MPYALVKEENKRKVVLNARNHCHTYMTFTQEGTHVQHWIDFILCNNDAGSAFLAYNDKRCFTMKDVHES